MAARACIALVLLLAGCGAGDGSTLDEEGRSIERPWTPALGSKFGQAVFPPTFEGIQQGFFEKFCTECHKGAGAPKGLDLSGEEAFEKLVNRRAVQRPNLFLVEPGSADRSYLIVKLEGGSGMSGRQMPRNRMARPQGEIDVIKQWIDEGAPRN